MKKWTICAIVFGLVSAAGWMVVSAQEDQYLEQLDTWAFESPRRPGAVFSHDDHIIDLDDDCSICHHVYEEGELVPGESSEDYYCSDCHSLKASPDNKMPLEAAYHNLCRDCHFDRGKGPVLCGECHIKE